MEMSVYADANLGGQVWIEDDTEMYLSISCCAIFIGKSLIHWASTKQKRISLSSTEAKITSATLALRETSWLKGMYDEIFPGNKLKITLYLDSISSIHILKSGMATSKLKHIKIDFSYLKQEIKRMNIEVKHCSTKDNIADLFTKQLHTERFEQMRRQLGVAVASQGSELLYSETLNRVDKSKLESMNIMESNLHC